LQVQVPKTVNEIPLSVSNSLICFKLSDDVVSRLRLVVTVREKSDGALIADVDLHVQFVHVGYFKKLSRFLIFMSVCLFWL